MVVSENFAFGLSDKSKIFLMWTIMPFFSVSIPQRSILGLLSLPLTLHSPIRFSCHQIKNDEESFAGGNEGNPFKSGKRLRA